VPLFRRRPPLEFTHEWRTLLDGQMAQWRLLDDDERLLVELGALELLERTLWEASRGFALTDDMRVLIAAQAALLTIGLDEDDPYPRVGPIIVHPTTVVRTEERAGPIDGTASDDPYEILGEAHYRGPILIAWDAARYEARHPATGRNVVFHEFAHQLDLRDGIGDGTPTLPHDVAIQRWIDVCTPRYEAVRAGTDDGLLDPYAGTDPAEFFAVATEVFFTLPREVRKHDPELYEVLDAYYQQDPAAREDRGRR
jgi:MtfA peptidase